MGSKITNFVEFHKDDFFGIQTGISGSDLLYPLKKTSGTSYEISEFGPCMNPMGFVSNLDCPDGNPLCNCPNKDLMPKGGTGNVQVVLAEPTDEELLSLLQKTNECQKIKEVLEPSRWFGIDYSNPHCLYNCYDTPGICGSSASYKGISGMDNTPLPSTEFPYAKRKAYTITNENDNTKNIYSYNTELLGLTGVTGPTGPDGLIVSNFKDYLAYSKTNATFWNTPEKTPLLRRAQTTLLTYQRIKITVNGDFDIKPGHILTINMPISGLDNITETRFAGSWMIYSIAHNMGLESHTMILSLMRDGNNNDPNTINSTFKGK